MKVSRQYGQVRPWFLVNIVIALCPPLYWYAGKQSELILGMPASFIYFMVVSISITASILYAYWQDEAAGEFTS